MTAELVTVSGNIVNLVREEIYPGTVSIYQGKITSIQRDPEPYQTYLLPGFIDSHIHLESSMLTPLEFARAAVVHGTVAVLADPHEIANVLGIEGVNYLLTAAAQLPFKFYFAAPSCVPASPFETSGAVLGPEQVDELLQHKQIKYLGEMMNFPGVINGDPEVLQKLALAQKYHKPIDGHAPGLRGHDLDKYIRAGISTDHECFSIEEALEKINFGMKILIREGSAAKNFHALLPLLRDYHRQCMFCSDDKHPDDLLRGHINLLVNEALKSGYDRFKVLNTACRNPIEHYRLEVGLLQAGDPADFLEVDNLENLRVLRTWINGAIVAEDGQTVIPSQAVPLVNNFRAAVKIPADFSLTYPGGKLRVMVVIAGQLITGSLTVAPRVVDGQVMPDPEQDILKIVVVNRYQDAPPAVGFIKNFRLKQGAIASSVAHDSHNIIAVGTNDTEICRAVNLIIEHKGGISAVNGASELVLPLPLAGIISDADCPSVAAKYLELVKMAKDLGTTLEAPFMTLSFMALLVIPKLKLSDRGLFDGEKFQFIDLFEAE